MNESFRHTRWASQRRGRPALGVILGVSLLLAVPGWASEDDPSLARTVGGGVALGGGVGIGGIAGTPWAGIGPLLVLPALELRFFTPLGHSVDFSVPIANAVLSSALLQGFVFGLDGFYNFNIGSEGVKLLLGPGLGFGVIGSAFGSAFSIKVPVVVGVEILTDSRVFGFSFQARPHVALAVGGAVAWGWGVVGVLGFNWYGVGYRGK